MAHQTLKFRVTGAAPLLMHCDQAVDPRNEWSKAMKQITSKRDKTDADLEELARLEWYASLYVNKDGKPCIPGDVIQAVFVAAAKKSKDGVKAKMGTFCENDYLLHFEGDDLSLDELWSEGNHRLTKSAKLQGKTVMRTRPQFTDWLADCEIVFDDEVFNLKQVKEILELAGHYVGLMDWRPRFGRFSIEFSK